MPRKTCTLIVAGYASVRAGLAALLQDTESVCVQGEVTDAGDALARMLPGLEPEAVLYDGTGSVGGLERVLAALAASEAPPALVVVGDAPLRELPVLQAAPFLPGWAYLAHDSESERIALAIQAAASGFVVHEAHVATPTPESDLLTPREIEVLALLAEGLPNKTIAYRLGITLHTAKFHVAQILAKLGATSRTEAVTVGARQGFVTL